MVTDVWLIKEMAGCSLSSISVMKRREGEEAKNLVPCFCLLLCFSPCFLCFHSLCLYLVQESLRENAREKNRAEK